jgi:hypothetical protein
MSRLFHLRKKPLSLNTVRVEVSDSFDEESLDEEEIAFLSKKFKKFLKFRKNESNKKPPKAVELPLKVMNTTLLG